MLSTPREGSHLNLAALDFDALTLGNPAQGPSPPHAQGGASADNTAADHGGGLSHPSNPAHPLPQAHHVRTGSDGTTTAGGLPPRPPKGSLAAGVVDGGKQVAGAKTLMTFRGCNKPLGCTVLLRGGTMVCLLLF